MNRRNIISLAFLAIGCSLLAQDDYEQAPIFYSETEPETPITRIIDQIDAGEPLLRAPTDREILRELLARLEIPIESQVLVYSKTSAQNAFISPSTPRAIYFSDNAYVGWVQGGNIEVVTYDEKLGAVFHMVQLKRRQPGASPKIAQDYQCLNCHAGSRTRGSPGVLARSVFPSASGEPLFRAGTHTIDYTSPMEERWGGWYVTGDTGEMTHMGNIIARESAPNEKIVFEKVTSEPIETLEGVFDCKPYLSGGVSDVVALMVLEHQIAAHNEFVRANHVTQKTLYRFKEMRRALGESEDMPLADSYERILDATAEDVVDVLLFKDEFSMGTQGPKGSLEFKKAFQANARYSDKERALKEFRLYDRVFKYRLSYTIYSDPFTFLPPEMKSRVFNRLKEILTATSVPDRYDYLSNTERKRILEIVSSTLPDWPQD